MKQYNRAEQRRIDLISVNEYTIHNGNETRTPSRRPHTNKALLLDPKDNGGGRHQSGRSGKKDRSGQTQHQQIDARKECCQHRLPAQDCREHRSRCGTESSQKIGEAA